eukprot:scaffold25987_cov30-Cyclotella_meneghiniana.AAC.3
MARLSTVMELPFDDDDDSTVDSDGAFVFSSPVKKNVGELKEVAKLSFCAVATNSYLGFV